MNPKLNSKRMLNFYIESDEAAMNWKGYKINFFRKKLSPRYSYLRRFRKVQYYYNTRRISLLHLFRSKFANFFWERYCLKIGVEIPVTTEIGPGFSIIHLNGILINGDALIGNCFTVTKGVTIGQKGGVVPQIGNNVQLMINSSVIGEGINADNVVIGAHSLVLKEIRESNTTWVGNPVKRIAHSISDFNKKKMTMVNKVAEKYDIKL